jgi:hypothetical protein
MAKAPPMLRVTSPRFAMPLSISHQGETGSPLVYRFHDHIPRLCRAVIPKSSSLPDRLIAHGAS